MNFLKRLWVVADRPVWQRSSVHSEVEGWVDGCIIWPDSASDQKLWKGRGEKHIKPVVHQKEFNTPPRPVYDVSA